MYEALITPVINIIKAASEAVLEVYNATEGIEVQNKSDNSPLTLADQRANDIIVKGLNGLEFKFPILSEENKAIPFKERSKFEYYWLVDPLDGTKEFIKRNGEFTVNIALIRKNQPVLGVVSVPVQNKIYWGIKGKGAYLLENGEERQLKANQFRMSDEALRVVTSRSHLNDATKKYVAQMNAPQFVPMGSSLKFLIIAEGKADVYPRYGLCMEWDTGAAHIILNEAGGKITQTDSSNTLIYNKESLLNPFFIAYGKVV
jgi:3'(2'), 5'-bisphosphate nucleotidase